jgi:phospholipid/cholesterol/gamma-HCH transport system permease protein
MIGKIFNFFAGIGSFFTIRIDRLGLSSRFTVSLLLVLWVAIRRTGLIIRELYFSGVRSLLIIAVSGLFVGMVLAVQGYEVLQRYGSTESLG